MKRRDFIAKYVPLALTPFVGEPLYASVMHPLSLKPETLKLLTFNSDRILVIINLSGGNDGLSTLVPVADMPTLYGPSGNRLAVKPAFGASSWGTANYQLNQSLAGFSSLISAQKLAAIHGVGSFQDGRSHFCSQDVFQTGNDVYDTSASGWIGKYFDKLDSAYNAPDDRPLAVSVGPVPRSFVAAGFSRYYSIHPAYNGTAFRQANSGCTKYLTELEIIRDSMARANDYNANVKAAYNAGTPSPAPDPDPYANLGFNFGNSLKTVARLIKGGLGAKIYNIDLNGFDTHTNQINTQNALLIALSQGIKTFVDDLNTSVNGVNYGDKVLGMTYSEFGRRILSNNGNGTDHGSAGPMFLFGNGVNTTPGTASGTNGYKNPAFTSGILGVGGLYKEINSQNQIVRLSGINGATNVTKEYDFREVYRAIMEQWFGVPSTVDISQIIKDPNPTLLSAPNIANVKAMING